MKRGSKAILYAGASIFIAWVIWHFKAITGDDGGMIRAVLGVALAFPVIFRWKRRDDREVSGRHVCGAALAGTALVVTGIVLSVNQFEWLGIVLLLYACLRWSLPASYSRDIAWGVFLLYWIHPLPSQVFGKLQLWMQLLSVNGTEWVMHCLNVRCWADGFILRTGVRVFEVPRVCSGMRTAVTVLMCTLGVGMLLRLRWYEVIPFLLLGLLQVLALNVARIAFMVIWSARMPIEWAEGFLHDSLGWFLMAAILLTQIEASWWKVRGDKARRLKEAIERGEAERPEMTTFLPRFWAVVHRWGWLALLILFLAAGATGVIYKRRAAHRSAMVAGIVEDLMRGDDLETAQRAAEAAIRLAPKIPRELLSWKAMILSRRGKFEEAIAEFDRLPGYLSTEEVVVKTGVLMALERGDEAIALINGLAPGQQRLPGVAILRAEYGARRDEPAVVRKNILLAARRSQLSHRVRALFPYLAQRNMWQVIVDADKFDLDYQDFAPALIAVHANLKTNNTNGAEEALKRAVRTWPDDHRLLSALFELAVKRPRGGWEEKFARNLKANISLDPEASKLGADRLAAYINYCFTLRRPDLAWLVMIRLTKVDADDPALSLAAARFGRLWFAAGKLGLGIDALGVGDAVDLRRFYVLTRDVEPLKSMWSRVPRAAEMAQGKEQEKYQRHVRQCLQELERRKKESRLSNRMKRMYPAVLAMAGRHEEAHAVLASIAEKSSERRADAMLQQALLYDSRGKFDEAYESSRVCLQSVGTPNLTAHLIIVNAVLNRNMGSYALEMLSRARRVFPDALEIDVAEAAVWDIFGAKDQALFLLGRRGAGAGSFTMVRLFYDTGRVREARKLGAGLGVRPRPDRKVARQWLALAPAELSVSRSWETPLSDDEMARREKDARAAATSRSPFFAAVSRLEAEWCAAGGKGMVWDPDKWRAAGRDNVERASALHRLAVILARQGEYGRAFEAGTQAIELTPHSAPLWRLVVALKEGDSETVDRARAQCPADPEIWLASIVAGVRGGKDVEWTTKQVRVATEADMFSVETIVRACDFLLRHGHVRAAEIGARHSVTNGRGLLPAYVLGIRCAVRTADVKWAQICALGGADHSLDPQPFLKTLVSLKSAVKALDGDLIRALEYLQSRAGKDAKWVQELGGVYFAKGDTARALSLLGPVIDRDVGSVRVNSLFLAAEAARMEGKTARAISILQAAYETYPRRADVLNNLVYNLAQDDKTMARAAELLPTLLELDNKSAGVLDTAAVVYLKSGRLPLAWRYMEKALERVRKGDYSAQEIRLNAARIRYRMGDYRDAEARLQAILDDPVRSAVVDREAKSLLAEVRDRVKKKDDR